MIDYRPYHVRRRRIRHWLLCGFGALLLMFLALWFALRIIADRAPDWKCLSAKYQAFTVEKEGALPYLIAGVECEEVINLRTGEKRKMPKW